MGIVTILRRQWDRAAAVAMAIAALVVLLLGWLGVSRTAFTAEQVPYILSGGLLGVFLLAMGAVLWLSADMRDEWRKLDRIERRLAEGHPLVVETDPESRGGGTRPELARR